MSLIPESTPSDPPSHAEEPPIITVVWKVMRQTTVVYIPRKDAWLDKYGSPFPAEHVVQRETPLTDPVFPLGTVTHSCGVHPRLHVYYHMGQRTPHPAMFVFTSLEAATQYINGDTNMGLVIVRCDAHAEPYPLRDDTLLGLDGQDQVHWQTWLRWTRYDADVVWRPESACRLSSHNNTETWGPHVLLVDDLTPREIVWPQRCPHCGRDNAGYADQPCSDDCPGRAGMPA